MADVTPHFCRLRGSCPVRLRTLLTFSSWRWGRRRRRRGPRRRSAPGRPLADDRARRVLAFRGRRVRIVGQSVGSFVGWAVSWETPALRPLRDGFWLCRRSGLMPRSLVYRPLMPGARPCPNRWTDFHFVAGGRKHRPACPRLRGGSSPPAAIAVLACHTAGVAVAVPVALLEQLAFAGSVPFLHVSISASS